MELFDACNTCFKAFAGIETMKFSTAGQQMCICYLDDFHQLFDSMTIKLGLCGTCWILVVMFVYVKFIDSDFRGKVSNLTLKMNSDLNEGSSPG